MKWADIKRAALAGKLPVADEKHAEEVRVFIRAISRCRRLRPRRRLETSALMPPG